MKASAFVHITQNGVWLDGKAAFAELFEDADDRLLVSIYKQLNIGYAKFYKMDDLSKLGFVGTELLKKSVDFGKYNDREIAQIFTNSVSSSDTDIKHQDLLNKGASPSPAIFVYTLPNIVMGEIAIRNKFYGENLFTLSDEFSPKKWLDLVDTQFKLDKATAVLGGWIELVENNFELKLYFIEKDNENGSFEIQ